MESFLGARWHIRGFEVMPSFHLCNQNVHLAILIDINYGLFVTFPVVRSWPGIALNNAIRSGFTNRLHGDQGRKRFRDATSWMLRIE